VGKVVGIRDSKCVREWDKIRADLGTPKLASQPKNSDSKPSK
jgi:hypothetical protein